MKNINSDYHEQIKIENTKKLREMQRALPPFCTTFFRGISETVSSRTLIAYSYDLQVFFRYMVENILDGNKTISEITLEDLNNVKKTDIEDYMDYLSLYVSEDGSSKTNDERGKARKLSALRRLYNYFYEDERISNNPAVIVHSPKLHDKNIIRLDTDEVAKFLDVVEKGSEKESKHMQAYHSINLKRDMAMMTLLLGTGIRVSECVGLNVNDIDFDNCCISIVRKGGNQARVYFGDEVEATLKEYLDERKKIIPLSGHEGALFLSMQNKRISVRAVQNLVKKYAQEITLLKNITPHKLRSTYGTNLYRESGDIYLVASVLGHKDVNTTRKHYADLDEDRKRQARNMVKLREN